MTSPTDLPMFDREVTIPTPVTGRFRDDDHPCPACDGSGYATTFDGRDLGTCTDCNGTGDLHRVTAIDTGPIPTQRGMLEDIGSPVVDVTDALTPGARALVKQRTEVVQRVTLEQRDPAETRALFDLVFGTTPTQAMTRAARLSADLRLATDRAFRVGRAYEQGAKVRTLVGKTLEHREERARTIALEYLDDADLPEVLRRELAVMVLAGFTGTDPAPMLASAAA